MDYEVFLVIRMREVWDPVARIARVAPSLLAADSTLT
jgi:hypothetical protein